MESVKRSYAAACALSALATEAAELVRRARPDLFAAASGAARSVAEAAARLKQLADARLILTVEVRLVLVQAQRTVRRVQQLIKRLVAQLPDAPAPFVERVRAATEEGDEAPAAAASESAAPKAASPAPARPRREHERSPSPPPSATHAPPSTPAPPLPARRRASSSALDSDDDGVRVIDAPPPPPPPPARRPSSAALAKLAPPSEQLRPHIHPEQLAKARDAVKRRWQLFNVAAHGADVLPRLPRSDRAPGALHRVLPPALLARGLLGREWGFLTDDALRALRLRRVSVARDWGRNQVSFTPAELIDPALRFVDAWTLSQQPRAVSAGHRSAPILEPHGDVLVSNACWLDALLALEPDAPDLRDKIHRYNRHLRVFVGSAFGSVPAPLALVAKSTVLCFHNPRRTHWQLLALDFARGRVAIYDSLGSPDSVDALRKFAADAMHRVSRLLWRITPAGSPIAALFDEWVLRFRDYDEFFGGDGGAGGDAEGAGDAAGADAHPNVHVAIAPQQTELNCGVMAALGAITTLCVWRITRRRTVGLFAERRGALPAAAALPDCLASAEAIAVARRWLAEIASRVPSDAPSPFVNVEEGEEEEESEGEGEGEG